MPNGVIAICLIPAGCSYSGQERKSIDLSGEWRFQLDKNDVGDHEKYCIGQSCCYSYKDDNKISLKDEKSCGGFLPTFYNQALLPALPRADRLVFGRNSNILVHNRIVRLIMHRETCNKELV